MAPLTNRRTVQPGDAVTVELPFSEVMMHMHLAGKVRVVHLLDRQYPMAQVIDEHGREFSGPVTTGEAGIYGDVEHGFYAYEVVS